MKAIILIVALSISTEAQTPAPSVPTPRERYAVDCSAVEEAPGCKSFNEMIAKNDKDILSSLDQAHPGYVCFRPEKDIFILVYSRPPYDFQFRNVPGAPTVVQADGDVYYERYEDGLQDDFKSTSGTWRKAPSAPELGMHFVHSPSSKNSDATLTDAQVSFSFTFENVQHNTTSYEIEIRRSTLRFLEQYSYDDPKTKQQVRGSYTGHCAEFN